MFEKSRILRFGLVGVAGFIVDAGVLMAVIGGLGPFGGRVLSFALAIVATWLLNRRFTFADRTSGMPLHIEFGRYFAAMIGGAVFNWAAYSVVILIVPDSGYWPVLAVAAGSLAGMLVNLALAQRFVFKRELP